VVCEDPMASYRLYCLDGLSSRITDAGWIDADIDDEALAEAKSLGKPIPCELWLGDRLVAKIAVHVTN
jgi:hypothetical protein